MRVCHYGTNGMIDDEWFIHFSFKSSYDGEEDCSQHDHDYWKAFWKLKSVSYDALCNGHYASPDAWNYIRELEDVNTDGLYMGKWVKKSPFYRDGKWQPKRS
jgi:hypothetical protein